MSFMRFLTSFSFSICTVMMLGPLAAEQAKEEKQVASEKKAQTAKPAPRPTAQPVQEEAVQKTLKKLQTLLGQQQYQEVVTLSESLLAQKTLSKADKQAGLTLRYFSLMGMRDFSKAVATAKALQALKVNAAGGQQARVLRTRAEAALAAANEEKAKPAGAPRPVQAGKPVPAKKAQEAAAAIAPAEKTDPAVQLSQSVAALKDSHKALELAEKAFVDAKAQLTAAREAHDLAHREELAARKAFEVATVKAAKANAAGVAHISKKEENKKPKPSEKADVIAPQIDEFESRATELQKKAAMLRKKAEELRKTSEE